MYRFPCAGLEGRSDLFRIGKLPLYSHRWGGNNLSPLRLHSLGKESLGNNVDPQLSQGLHVH